MTRITKFLGFTSVAALTVSALAAQAVMRQLTIDGKVASTDVVQEDGHYMVPLDDVAKYFGYALSVNGANAILTKTPAAQPTATTNATNGYAQQFANGTAPQPGQITDPAAAPGIAATSMPATTTVSNLIPAQTQPQTPTQIATTMGKSASVNGFDYTVTSIQDVGAKYKDAFDQRGATVHPKWKTDTLVAIEIEEANRGTQPMQAVFPGATDVTAFDNNKIGYPASYLDVRQSSAIDESDSDDDDSSMYSTTGMGNANLMIGPGGVLHFAAIVSVPKGDSIGGVMLKLAPGTSADPNAVGTIVMISR